MVVDSNVISAFGSIASAMAAGAGLCFVGIQIRAARKSFDLQTLQAFMQHCREHEDRLLNSVDEARDQAYIEYLNFLEVYAAAINHSLMPNVSMKVVKEKLLDSMVMIEAFPEWRVKLIEATSSPYAFTELRRLRTSEAATISRLKAAKRKS